MWWDPNESGWGANIIQQGDTMFVTLFVYNSSNNPTWFVAPNTGYTGGTGTFTGPLYSVTGPYYGVPFNPANVVATQVGTLTFTASNQNSAALEYFVNGLRVNKTLQRQTWRNETLAGSYRGGTIGTFTGCPGTSFDDQAATFTVQQTGTNVTINEFGNGYTCRYNGTYTQTGKTGSMTGTGTCTPDVGVLSFVATNITVTRDGMMMSFRQDVGTCSFNGRLGGIRQQ
jgi:hypothetical protein